MTEFKKSLVIKRDANGGRLNIRFKENLKIKIEPLGSIFYFRVAD